MEVHQWENEEVYTFPNKSFLNPEPALENIHAGPVPPCVCVVLEAVLEQSQGPEATQAHGRKEGRIRA